MEKKTVIKDTKSNPLPKTIREFKYHWMKPQYMSYSDEQIVWLMEKLLQQKDYITLENTTYKK